MNLRALAQAAITASLPLSGGDESDGGYTVPEDLELAPLRRG